MELKTRKERHIALPLYATVVTITGPDAGKISTDLEIEIHDWMGNQQKEKAEAYNLKVRGIEAIILAHALCVLDIESKEYLIGYELAVESITPNKDEILAMKD